MDSEDGSKKDACHEDQNGQRHQKSVYWLGGRYNWENKAHASVEAVLLNYWYGDNSRLQE